MVSKIKNELSEFSESICCFKFNEDKLKFEKIDKKYEFIDSMINIINFLEKKNLKYSIEYNQDITIKLNEK